MTGISMAGVRVDKDHGASLPRPRHPLSDATVREARSTLIAALRGAGHPTDFIARVLRVVPRQVNYDAKVPPVSVGRDADAA